jgi:hypothetical protein
MVREMQQDDSQSVLEIYSMGLDTRNSIFETTVPSWEEWDLKHFHHSRFVFEENGNESLNLMVNGEIQSCWKEGALKLFNYYSDFVSPRMWQDMNNPRFQPGEEGQPSDLKP